MHKYVEVESEQQRRMSSTMRSPWRRSCYFPFFLNQQGTRERENVLWACDWWKVGSVTDWIQNPPLHLKGKKKKKKKERKTCSGGFFSFLFILPSFLPGTSFISKVLHGPTTNTLQRNRRIHGENVLRAIASLFFSLPFVYLSIFHSRGVF